MESFSKVTFYAAEIALCVWMGVYHFFGSIDTFSFNKKSPLKVKLGYFSFVDTKVKLQVNCLKKRVLH